jgi:hypothetical protein
MQCESSGIRRRLLGAERSAEVRRRDVDGGMSSALLTGKLSMAILSVLAIFFVVAFLVYGTFSAVTGLATPGGASPLVFLTSVLVVKLGHAVAFVLLFHLARGSFSPNWLLYAFSWWLMFVIGELGQAIAPNYSWQEAIAGIISETLYFPAAAFVTKWWLATR